MINPGSIVRFRNREWVMLPSDQTELYVLRPLTGATDNTLAVHKKLMELASYSLPEERITSANFPLPTPNHIADAAAAHLLWQASRLTLREGAAPFRSLGRISIRPRTYQFVPLMMALRLDPVRMLIADDVGVGKTIEALLVARELWDRGEIKRFCVLCPPYLCEQWQQEIQEKFNLEAVIVRSGTISQLERNKPVTRSIYQHYPIQVISIDFAKSDRNKHMFLQDCPELVIVDEAHGTAVADPKNMRQHQRYQLVRKVADTEQRHLILLTATPHSGVVAAFQNLLGFLHPDFAQWDPTALSEPQRIRLAKHFVQRTRKDIERIWDKDVCFPERISLDETYTLSPQYHALFKAAYEFSAELVKEAREMESRRQRVYNWGALALLRCVMSSPRAAEATLENRSAFYTNAQLDSDKEIDSDHLLKRYIFEATDQITDDALPIPPIESAEKNMSSSKIRKLQELKKMAAALAHQKADSKLQGCIDLVTRLLKENFAPIVWCRYIATADYVADGIQMALQKTFPDLRVVSITGVLGDEERRAKVDELINEKQRVLVATDCLSEGINLQEGFNAVIHYDLPWNPNRLEQREGRVDRFGQNSKTIKTIRYFSPENPVDGVVIDVLLNKAREIHKSLGTYVPVPEESESVTQAVLNALFFRKGGLPSDPQQLSLDLGLPEVHTFHRKWDAEVNRERVNRTRFAQRALKPEEVRREVEETDQVLGEPDAVKNFVLTAAQRLNLPIKQELKNPNVYRVYVDEGGRSQLPESVKFALPETKSVVWRISFVSPVPEGATYVGRNHRFVTTLAQYLLEEALEKGERAHAARCGAIRTKAVQRLTILYLIRIRYLIQQQEQPDSLAEEVLVLGQVRGADWLERSRALQLLAEAEPDANLSIEEKKELVSDALAQWTNVQQYIEQAVQTRAEELLQSHRRVRQSVAIKVRGLRFAPQMPPDLLGVLVLQPVVS
jgi:superfamily II DNA or RNA helicase